MPKYRVIRQCEHPDDNGRRRMFFPGEIVELKSPSGHMKLVDEKPKRTRKPKPVEQPPDVEEEVEEEVE